MKEQKITQQGFVIYRDMLEEAMNILQDRGLRGDLLTALNEYVNNGKTELPADYNDAVKACFAFLTRGIRNNAVKYIKRKKAQKEYYERKKHQSDGNAQNGNNAIFLNNNTNSNSNSNSNPNSNENIGNSLSENKTYTKDVVKSILEEREIYFKESFFSEYYAYNDGTMHWKYDPYSAALVFIRRHPDAIKKARGSKENAPHYAAPPAEVEADYAATMRSKAAEWWAEMLDTIRANVPADEVDKLDKVKPVSAGVYGYSLREITLYVPDIDIYHFCRQNIENTLKTFRFTRIEYSMPDDVKAAVDAEVKAARERYLASKKASK